MKVERCLSKLNTIITSDQIEAKIADLAVRISGDYRDKNPVLVGVLKGSFIFLADIVRALNIPLRIDFIGVSSYGGQTESSGQLELLQDLKTSVTGMDVLVIEDIVDTGLSLNYVLNMLHQKTPASVKVCTLLDKPSKRKITVPIDYSGFTIPDKFVVGYGLDFDEQYRYLSDICYLEDE